MAELGDVHEAETCAELVQQDPAESDRRAAELLDRIDLSDEARAVAVWARGLAARELGELERSEQLFGRAIAFAHDHGLSARAAMFRVSQALTLANLGRFDDALAEIASARSNISDLDLARLDQQEALIRQRRGELAHARKLYRRSLRRAEANGDAILECRVQSNLGVLEGYSGHIDDGIALLVTAGTRAADLGQHLLEARAAHNLGFLSGRKGDVPGGLRWFDRALTLYEQIGAPPNDVLVLEADRATLLLDAGLHEEAARMAEASVRTLGGPVDSIDAAELQIVLARALLASGDASRAEQSARDAARTFADQGRDTWAWTASLFAIDCASRTQPTSQLVHQAADLAARLNSAGIAAESRRGRLLAARIALTVGDPTEADRQIEDLPAPAKVPIAADRAAMWLLTAQLRAEAGNSRGAKRALHAAARAVDAHQGHFGSFELRSRAAESGERVARLGLELAVEDGRPSEIFAWAERSRAGALRLVPAHEPEDESLRSLLRQLRRAEADAAEAQRLGADAGANRAHTEIESRVRDLMRSKGVLAEPSPSSASTDLTRVKAALDGRTLLEFFVLDGDLHAITVTRAKVRHHRLEALESIAREILHLRFAIDRLARPARGGASTSASIASLRESASQIEESLFGPLESALKGELIIIPSGPLHELPWRALDVASRRHVTVAPSAHVWLRAEADIESRSLSPIVLAAGPDLTAAESEVQLIARTLAETSVLVGERSTCDAVRADLARSSVAHIAAHGVFRSDNPLFSSLVLADGSFTAYDLEGLERTPWLVVLPACHAAATAIHPGDELLGFCSALLASGVSTVVAPVNAIPDSATSELMISFYKHLSAGETPAGALTAAADETRETSAQALAAAAAFTVVGGNSKNTSYQGGVGDL